MLGVMHHATHDVQLHDAVLHAAHSHLAHAQVLADVGRVGVALAHVVVTLVRGQVRVDEAQVRRAHAEGDGDATLVRAHAAHARRHLGRRHARARRVAGRCCEWGCRLVLRVGLQTGAASGVAGWCCEWGLQAEGRWSAGTEPVSTSLTNSATACLQRTSRCICPIETTPTFCSPPPAHASVTTAIQWSVHVLCPSSCSCLGSL